MNATDPIAFQASTTRLLHDLQATKRKPVDRCATGCADIACHQGRLPCPHRAQFVAEMREMGVVVEAHETERRRFRAGTAALFDDADLWRHRQSAPAVAAPPRRRVQVFRAAFRGAFWWGWACGVISGAFLVGAGIGAAKVISVYAHHPAATTTTVKPMT